MKFATLSLLVAVLFLMNIFFGSVDIPCREVMDILLGGGDQGPLQFIVLASRLPMAVTAMLAGAGLAVSGLMLQTAFRNPLAGPSILGITSGASVGVALVILLFGGSLSFGSLSLGGNLAVIVGAFAGSVAVMLLLLVMSSLLKNDLMLLIAGIMTGYIASSVIMLLNYASSAEGIQGYVMWGMSSFNGVTLTQLPVFSSLTIVGVVMSLFLVKPLNLLLLGDGYAANLGVNIRRVRNLLLLATGLLCAVITAYCGPVSFIGLAVPHIARMVFPTDNHRVLLPATLLCGAVVALGCNLLCVAVPGAYLPVNAITPMVGAPVVIWVLFKRRF